jgi:hypothetical protein
MLTYVGLDVHRRQSVLRLPRVAACHAHDHLLRHGRDVGLGSGAAVVARLTVRPVCPPLRKCRVRPGGYVWCHEPRRTSPNRRNRTDADMAEQADQAANDAMHRCRAISLHDNHRSHIRVDAEFLTDAEYTGACPALASQQPARHGWVVTPLAHEP